MKISLFRPLLLTFCFTIFVSSIGFAEESSPSIDSSLSYKHAIKRLDSLNYESRFYVHSNPEILILLSRYQDTLLKFLRESETPDVFLEGMREIDYRGNLMTMTCFYGLKHINFHDFSHPVLDPQLITLDYRGVPTEAYLNTFKRDWVLSEEEREELYEEEEAQFLKDAEVFPFDLNEESLETLVSETLYNYVLLPDGTVRAALERPGDREYHVSGEDVEEKFSYPNHSMIAGSANQAVITAGAFIMFQEGNKRIFFVSNKSGHYLPKITSLEPFQEWFGEHNVDMSTIVLLPDVDIAKLLVKNYNKVEVPVSVKQSDAKRLFEMLRARWQETFERIDRSFLEELASGNFARLTPEEISKIYALRDEATYMRSGLHLFTSNHEAPQYFHRFVKRFGKLKDGIKHGIPERIVSEAKRVLELMDIHGRQLSELEIEPCDEESFQGFLKATLQLMDFLLSQKSLPIDDFHEIKKSSRELGTLFMLLSLDDERRAGDAISLYRAKADEYFQINTIMADIHDEYVKKIMLGEIESDGVEVEVPELIAARIERNNLHIRLEPIKVLPQVSPTIADWLKDEATYVWDVAHFNMVEDEEVIRPLRQMMNGEPIEVTPYFEEYLIVLRSTAQVVLRAYEVFHEGHQPPKDLKWYMRLIDKVLKEVPHRQTTTIDPVEIEGVERFLTPLLPSIICKDFLISDQETLTKTYNKFINNIRKVNESRDLTIGELVQVYENAEKLAALLELFKRSRMVGKEYPKIVFDSMSRLVNALVVEVKHSIQENSSSFDKELIEVNPEMDALAERIVMKLR